jgi:hypothetical protein
MVDLHFAIWMTLVHDVDCPFASLLVVFGTSFNCGFIPYIQFHRFGIVFEPAGKLILGSCEPNVSIGPACTQLALFDPLKIGQCGAEVPHNASADCMRKL